LNDYSFEIYYQYDGPSVSDPFAKQKTEKEIQDSLDNFYSELPSYIDAYETNYSYVPIEGNNDRRKLTIRTTADERQINMSIDKCLKSHDLRAEKLLPK
jgi:hypothetical protein